MGLFDDAVPGGNIAKPLIVALGALLVGKMLSGGSAAPAAPSAPPAPAPEPLPQPQGGGVGGLGGLLERLTQSGHGETVNTWVGSGPNAPIQPQSLGSALGRTTVSDLARASGMSEQELLAQLSRVLPGVVDRLTPGGRVPSDAEVASVWGRQAG
ncbi:MAG TPA: YidB family protein [Acidisphaera sp.]|nr:YidB family protein [Acidisphaera sp.]